MEPKTAVIPPHMRVEGRCEIAGDLRVEGRCDGELEVEGTVTIARGGICRASVRARSARVLGEVIGAIACAETIEVVAGARVVGDLRAPDVTVDGDATVDGKVDLLAPAPVSLPVRRVKVGSGSTVRRPQVPAAPPEVGGTRAIPAPPRPRGRKRVTRASQGDPGGDIPD